MRARRSWFVLAWMAAAVVTVLLAQAATIYVVGPIVRGLAQTASSPFTLRMWPLVGRGALAVLPAAGYGLALAAFYGARIGLRWGVATFLGLVLSLGATTILAPVLNPPSAHTSVVGFLVLQAIGAFIVGLVQWLGVLRREGDAQGLWIVIAIVATLANVVVSLTWALPPPTVARGATTFAIAWPGLLLYAAVTGVALALLLRPRASRGRKAKARSALRHAANPR